MPKKPTRRAAALTATVSSKSEKAVLQQPTRKSKAVTGRIMYIESKGGGLTGPAKIGRVSFSKTGKTIYYLGKHLKALKALVSNPITSKWNPARNIGFQDQNGTDKMRSMAEVVRRSMKMCARNTGKTFAANRSEAASEFHDRLQTWFALPPFFFPTFRILFLGVFPSWWLNLSRERHPHQRFPQKWFQFD